MRTDLAKKLNLKDGCTVAVLGDGPELDLGLPTTSDPDSDAVIAFVRHSRDIPAVGHHVFHAARADRIAWIAYPKGKQLDTDLSRNQFFTMFPGIRPVRQVSIDSVWSALRFRPR